MDQYLAANRARWDELVPIHARSPSYDLQGFRAGELSLHAIEREALGDVAGKSLLHLQCHFGMDTLSWARLGAQVTGVDFSEPAIDLARALSEELDIPATFICSDVYKLPNALDGLFDIVFTSYGVLCWLPDLPRWAAVATHFLRPGGTFYVVDMHPFGDTMDDAEGIAGLRIGYPYFGAGEPYRFEVQGSYADREAEIAHAVTYEWSHGLGDVVNALIDAGLRIEFLHEFPYCVYQKLPAMEQGPDGWWRLPDADHAVPFLFSIRAVK